MKFLRQSTNPLNLGLVVHVKNCCSYAKNALYQIVKSLVNSMAILCVLVGWLLQVNVPVLFIILLLGSHAVPVPYSLHEREQTENNDILSLTVTILSSSCGERASNKKFNKIYG